MLMLANPRCWRAPISLGLGLPLLLGSTPAAAAGTGGALAVGLTPWLGIVAAAWALLLPMSSAFVVSSAGATVLVAMLLASAGWVWRTQRGRFAGPRGGRGVGGRTVASFAGAAPTAASASSPAHAAQAAWPSALDGEQVLAAARSRFLRLQAAWDAGDVATLGHLTTPDMFEQLLSVLGARGNAPNRTDIVSLHAELIAVEEVSAAYLASVEFSGLIRESADEGAVPFRELWMLACEKDGSPGWRLARQQALF